jgi:hypothetical protein
MHPLLLIHVLNVRLSLHQRLLTSLLPRPSVFLSSPSRLSDCRPSFIDNHKAQPLLERQSFSFTSLVGVTVIRLHLYAIHHFHLTTSFNPNRLIDLCKSRRFLGPAHWKQSWATYTSTTTIATLAKGRQMRLQEQTLSQPDSLEHQFWAARPPAQTIAATAPSSRLSMLLPRPPLPGLLVATQPSTLVTQFNRQLAPRSITSPLPPAVTTLLQQ